MSIDLLQKAIRCGKAAYCEKPIDLDITKVKAVVQEAAQTDLPISIGFRRRFLPEYQAMRQSIQQGDLGALEVVYLLSRDHQPQPIDYLKVSGGLLRDKTIHYFDLACWLMDEQPTEVYATGACLINPAIGEIGDVDTALVILRMPSGALCHIDNNRRAIYGYDERIEVFGAKGLLQSSPKRENQVSRLTESGIIWQISPSSATYFAQESFAAALDAFIRAVEGDAPVAPSLMDGFQAQLIAEAATESLRPNRPVPILYESF